MRIAHLDQCWGKYYKPLLKIYIWGLLFHSSGRNSIGETLLALLSNLFLQQGE